MELDFDVATWLAAEGLTREIAAEFDRAGVPHLLLKGATVAGWLYDPGEYRAFGDVDLLVSPADLPRAERVLKDLGFANRYDGVSPEWAEEHADAWIAEGRLATVDLHRRLWGINAEPAEAWDRLWAGREELSVLGHPVQALGEDGRALALALHAAHHGDLSPKAAEDLRRGIARLEPAIWERARDLALAVDAGDGLSGGLAQVPAGVELRDRLGLEPADREQIVVEPWSWSLPATADGLLRLGEVKGVRNKATMIWQEAVPSQQFMRTRSREVHLARRGRAGLVAAYASRWVRLLRSLPEAIVAARRHRSNGPPRT